MLTAREQLGKIHMSELDLKTTCINHHVYNAVILIFHTKIFKAQYHYLLDHTMSFPIIVIFPLLHQMCLPGSEMSNDLNFAKDLRCNISFRAKRPAQITLHHTRRDIFIPNHPYHTMWYIFIPRCSVLPLPVVLPLCARTLVVRILWTPVHILHRVLQARTHYLDFHIWKYADMAEYFVVCICNSNLCAEI